MDSMVSLYLSECSFAPGAVVELRTREDAKVVARSPNRRTSCVRLGDGSLRRVLTHNVRQAAGTDPPSLPLVQYVCPVDAVNHFAQIVFLSSASCLVSSRCEITSSVMDVSRSETKSILAAFDVLARVMSFVSFELLFQESPSI